MKERLKDELFGEAKHYYVSSNTRRVDYMGKLSYRTAELSELLAQNSLRAGSDIVVRFVVRRHRDTDAFEVLWGKEGGVSRTYPAHSVLAFGTDNLKDHYQEIYSCVSAGNANFNSKTQQLLLINHKSGDFKPDFTSLQYAIAAMQQSGVQFSPNFVLEKVGSSNASQEKEEIQLAEIKHRLPEVTVNNNFPTIYGRGGSAEEFEMAYQAIGKIEKRLKDHEFVLNGGGESISICEQKVSKGARDIFLAIRSFRKTPDCRALVSDVEIAIRNKIKPTALGIFNYFGGRDASTAKLYQDILQEIKPLQDLIAKSTAVVSPR